MQISPISNNQTNFKGQMIFKEQCIKLGRNIQPQNCLAIPSESVKFVAKVGEPTIEAIETALKNSGKKMYTVGLQKYKTVILAPYGNAYLVTADFKKIFDAKKKVDGTSKFVEV